MINPDDTSVESRRDGELASAGQAAAKAAAAEAAGDHPAAQALHMRATDHTRRARAADEQLRTQQARRRADLALTLRQRHAATIRDTEASR